MCPSFNSSSLARSCLKLAGVEQNVTAVYPPGGVGEQTSYMIMELPWAQSFPLFTNGERQVITKVYMKTSLIISLYGMSQTSTTSSVSWCAFTAKPAFAPKPSL